MGGDGEDLFVFATGDGADTIRDLEPQDTLDLIGYGITDINNDGMINMDDLSISDVDGNAFIDLGGGDSITLVGVLVAQLTNDSFSLVG